MADKISKKAQTIFEQIKRFDENGNEYWSGRELGKILEYSEFRHFKPVIDKAKEACKNSGQTVENHFEDYLEMVKIGSGAERPFDDGIKLSRYACYLIVQNADPSKEIVATGQTYFAIQTRLQEIRQMDEYNRLSTEEEKRLFLRNEMKKHNSQLAEAAKDAGVIESRDYAIFQNHGYMGLYGGLDAKAIHATKGLKKSQHILDHMGSTELAANLFIAALLSQTEEETERLFTQIDSAQLSDYEKKEAQNIKYNILLHTKGESVAETYLEQNITNATLRREAIQKALQQKNFERATSLAKDGISYDGKERPGLAKEWYDRLLQIAQAQNDAEGICKYARILLIENFGNQQDYYQILKQHIKPAEWNSYIEAAIQDISTQQKRWPNTDLIASIFIKEEWWNRLLELVKQTPGFSTIDHYEKYLSKDYANEIAELYTTGILRYMKNSIGSEHYQNACKYIRKIRQLGAMERADKIISHLRNEYPKRRALIEELDKL